MFPSLADLLHLTRKTLEAVLVLPAFTDPGLRIRKQRHKALPDKNLASELPLQLIEPDLTAIGPNAQHIGKIIDRDHAWTLCPIVG
jgi:hypothetical protein